MFPQYNPMYPDGREEYEKLISEAEETQENNFSYIDNQYTIKHFTGRCSKCGSSDLWDDNLTYGCNQCGEFWTF